ncbi:MAG TPA: OmpA family protein [Vicinamibacterales bacterium]|jgi:outer membrane protein OmpA-like peptidoglycan-associated protein|nr:OmpA family protein [Vicinamibacterales bacterium]
MNRPVAWLVVVGALAASAACGPRRVDTARAAGPSTVVLLADPDGTVGSAVVSSAAGAGMVDLSGDRAATTVAARRPPSPPTTVDAAAIEKQFGQTLATLPAAPEAFTLYFRLESNDLTDDSRALLPGVLKAVAGRPAPEVGVVGHTDTTGDSKTNYTLGLDRANSVRTLLISAGVDASLIDISSLGESDPRIRTADNVLEPRNRRVEISVR